MPLLLGFAGVLLLMSALAVDSARQLRDVTLNSTRLRRDYIERDRLMDKLRGEIYHAGTLMRDGLLTHDELVRRGRQTEVNELRRQNEETLAAYKERAIASESGALNTLRDNSREYFDELDAALAIPPPAGRRREGTIFRGTVIPQRASLIGLVAQIDALNRRDADAGEARIQALQTRFQRRVESLSVVAIALSLILAMFVILQHRRLERKAASQFAEIQDARRNLRLLSNRLLAAQEQERRNISRELHDQVGQSMSALLIDLGRAESKLRDTETCREILGSARQIAAESLARVRDLSLLLRPSMLDELGLVPALQWQAREVMRRTNLKVKMIAGDLDHDLPDEHRTAVFRIVQEALHNCVKHAEATEARVVFTVEADGLTVSVQDNGKGFDPRRQKGLGLLGIEERASHLGGIFSLDSAPGGGTALSVRLPLPPGDFESREGNPA
ncbi:MAG: ATP-binding protein [Bryobacterales bacterium]|nr:ATP-binding protein [Bryobacterales bacterium]